MNSVSEIKKKSPATYLTLLLASLMIVSLITILNLFYAYALVITFPEVITKLFTLYQKNPHSFNTFSNLSYIYFTLFVLFVIPVISLISVTLSIFWFRKLKPNQYLLLLALPSFVFIVSSIINYVWLIL